MAINVARQHSPRRTRAWYLFACLFLACAALATLLLSPHGPVRWAGLVLLPPAVWCLLRWKRHVDQAKTRLAIGKRLSRLPDDFLVLHGLLVPSPWGVIEIDHLILSRFGVVVVGDGPTPGWMLERVEAVRSLLFARGLAQPGFPIQPLVLLPPGVSKPRRADLDSAMVRVEHVTLEHLAPSRFAVFTAHQIQAIVRCLAGEKAVA